ncbi:MAG TPA: PAS domain-containing protein [Nitrospira sp.]|nr:PAS domain-containing protein [Nitrospira sp.]
MFENLPIMLVAFDDQQRTLARNHECERVTGYQAQEMIGKPDAYQLLFGVGAKVDGTALGKRPVQ